MLEEYMQMMFTKGSGNKLMNSYNMYRRHTDFLLESLVLFSISEVLIVPTGISNCSMVEENHLGLVMHSPEEAASAVEAVTELEYREYVRCVAE